MGIEFSDYLPSKKFTKTVFSVLVLLGIAFSVSFVSKLLGGDKAEEQLAVKYAERIKDSDEDGLKDWEETLWKTDSLKKDTDGDGTNDWEEISAGRNPIVTGPDDSLEKTMVVPSTAPGFATSTISKTDLFAQEFLTKYLEVKEMTGGEMSEASMAYLVNYLMSSILNNAEVLDKYAEKDIKITADNSVESLKRYGNKVAEINTRYQKITGMVDVKVLKEAIETGDGAILEDIGETSVLQKKELGEFLNVMSPSSVASQHLDIVNGLYMISDSLTEIKESFDDIVGALPSIASYWSGYEKELGAFTDLKSFLKEKGVVFYEGESGYLMFK